MLSPARRRHAAVTQLHPSWSCLTLFPLTGPTKCMLGAASLPGLTANSVRFSPTTKSQMRPGWVLKKKKKEKKKNNGFPTLFWANYWTMSESSNGLAFKKNWWHRGLHNILKTGNPLTITVTLTWVTKITEARLFIYFWGSFAAHHFIGWCVCCHFPNPELSSAH